ncbi:MAG TPA: helix-turn-helix transcriptional regulator [Flavitalea sp.]|nr:helix-turn-helix transcriptional regulator [Flavitalea sp.]
MTEKVMNEKVYNRIKAVLAEERKTNMWLAEQLEMSPNTVSKWCTNQMQPTIETLFRIASVLEVEARDLLVNSKR